MPLLNRSGLYVGLLLVLSAGSRAASSPLPESQDHELQDLGEYEDVLSQLVAAGNPVTDRELAAMLQDGQERGEGLALWRQSVQDGCLPPGYLKVDWAQPAFSLRVRSTRTGCRRNRWRASFSWSRDELTLWTGDVALAHGFGLLAGNPGRTASPGAGRSLGWGTSGLKSWPYDPSGSALRGMGAGLVRGGLSLETLAGDRVEAAGTSGGGYRLVRVTYSPPGASDEVALLWLHSPLAGGVSLAARRQAGMLATALEVVAGTVPDGAEGPRAFMGRVKVVASRSVAAEGAAAWCRSGEMLPLATRPGVLNGWNGGGWALRTMVHPVQGATVKLLFASAEQESPVGAHLDRRRITEVLVNWSWAGNWQGSLRWRGRKTAGVSGSERFPWQPATAEDPRVLTTSAMAVVWKGDRSRIRISVRTKDEVKPEGGGTRCLWSVTADRRTQGGWRLRGAWGEAWGDEVDLVSALSPLQGYVVPRHWSRWRRELMLGVGREIGSWRLQAGIAGRDPAPPTSSSRTRLEGWLEISARW